MNADEGKTPRDSYRSSRTDSDLPEMSLHAGASANSHGELFDLPGYTVLDDLGSGGMGRVCRAVQEGTQRTVAVKIIHNSAAQSRRARIRFQREVEVAARLEHPHIARVYDSGVHRGVYYYAMELIEGRHLDRYVYEHQLSAEARIRLFIQVCHAITYAHQRGVIHRDLKPSNLLIDKQGEPHVLDFGLAKAMDVRLDLPPVSIDGELAGTLAYMSPEQAIGHHDDVDVRSDVFSLGAVLFELITGELPHDHSGTRFEQQHRIIHETPRRPRSIKSGIDSDLEAVICKAIAKDRSDRYASVSELSDDLARYLERQPVSARPLTAPYFIGKWAKRHRTRIAIVLLVVGLALGFGAATYHGYVTQKVQSQFNAESAAHNRYLNQIVLCRRAMEQGQSDRAKALLDACDPEKRGWEWYWLKQNVDHSFFVLRSQVRRLEHSWLLVESRRLYTLDATGELSEWSTDSGRRRTSRRLYEGSYTSQKMAGLNPCLALWSSEDGLAYWDGRHDAFHSMPKVRLHEHALIISPSGRHVAWRSSAHGIKVWQPDDDRVYTIDNPDGMRLIAISSKQTWLVLCSGLKLRLLDYSNGSTIAEVAFDGSEVSNATFDKHGKRLVIGSRSGRVITCLAPSLQSGWVRDAHHAGTRCVAISPDGNHVATGGGDNMIRVWRSDTGDEVAVLRGAISAIKCVRFDNTGTILTSSHLDGTVRCWRIDGAQQPREIAVPTSSRMTAIGFSPDGSAYASGEGQGAIRLGEMGQDDSVIAMAGRGETADLAFSNSGSMVIAVSYTGDVVLLDRDGQLVRAFRIESGNQIFSTSFSPDDQHVAIQTALDVRVYSIPSLDEVARLQDASNYTWHSDPGSLFIVQEYGIDTDNYQLSLRSIDSGYERPICTLSSWISHLALSPAGELIAVVMGNQTVSVRRIKTGEEIALFHPSEQSSGGIVCAFMSDDRRLITAGEAVSLWDLRTGTELLELPDRSKRGAYLDVQYIEKPDGNWIVAASRTGLSMWRGQ